ncbi:hypothetical protein [Mycoplasmopsis cricetuli]|uniref:hypothetical protein n=1 Tax=Mycoplasmopsis cricetuli TaxID=171283 RepID=UPI00046ED92B|nr:hypothetical protein [Mycoplasmopsis cricetuli]
MKKNKKQIDLKNNSNYFNNNFLVLVRDINFNSSSGPILKRKNYSFKNLKLDKINKKIIIEIKKFEIKSGNNKSFHEFTNGFLIQVEKIIFLIYNNLKLN